MKPSLLLVCSDSAIGGAPGQVALLARNLGDDYEITGCCPDGWLASELRNYGITVYPWPEGNFAQIKQKLSKLYFRLRPDIIHCHATQAGIYARLAERPKTTSLVYTEHLWTFDLKYRNRIRQLIKHKLLKAGARRGDWVIAVSHAVERYLVTSRKVTQDRISVIYGAITPMPIVNPTDKPTIGTLGKLTQLKGVSTLLRAVALLVPEFPHLACVIGGDGPERSLLEQLAVELEIEKRCQFIGEVSNQAKFFEKLMIYVQPSNSETFGLAAGEAMSAGLPVVVSSVGGLPELIGAHQAGLSFPPGDAEALAAQIRKLLTDDELRRTIGTAGHERAAEFSIKKFIDQHKELYARLIDEKKN